MFYDILEGKNAFLRYKTKKLKKLKNWGFSKGVSPFLHLFSLGNIGQEKVFYDILEGKKHLSRLRNQEVQKVEKLRFFLRGYR